MYPPKTHVDVSETRREDRNLLYVDTKYYNGTSILRLQSKLRENISDVAHQKHEKEEEKEEEREKDR